ncbi:ABC transporter substrate-binding protein [Alkalilimnicola sp. S0819]|nr:ABC transporter substrate-binding protein [Alkalilimnicola sp. S0819]MPQ15278.1 ABC transporter substrate-binding protein [Alkalilimnicola sp. S0819]
MYGEPKYGPDFSHFDYANPDAPKGGRLRLSALGSFDSLNPFILKGQGATGLGMIYDTLTVSSADEPFTQYGLLAERIEVPEDRSWVRFTLREQARFHDGEPVTVEDVIYSFNLLREKGHPQYRLYWASVSAVERSGPRSVTFRFEGGQNREMPLIVGSLPVLPRHYWEARDFAQTTLEPPLGSGPYRIESVEPGRRIVYRRVADYWGAELAVNRGRHNFDRIRYAYYRDASVALEAFKGGAFDVRLENIAKNWATAYDVPAAQEGRLKKLETRHSLPAGMQGFFYNTRRPVFQDRTVRRALSYAFDFQWTNKTLFYGAYQRTESFFANSELAAREPISEAERELLAPYREQLPEEVFTQVYQAPSTDGVGLPRRNLRIAARLLDEAGWELREGRRVHGETGRVLRFEILLYNPSFERVVLPFMQNLERLGVEASVRTVDATQYVERMKQFDFDLTVAVIGQSLSPGNEQRQYWGSAAADTPGSRNYAGISDPVVDALIDSLIAAPDREALIHRTRALDRVLLFGHYVIPHYYTDRFRLAYWDRFGRPERMPEYGLPLESTWWAREPEPER